MITFGGTLRSRAATTVLLTALLGGSMTGVAAASPGHDGHHGIGKHRAETIVFGHRGASGYRPEHTLAAYQLAIEQGADYIEPDLVSSKDGVLFARHENEIGGTTDVADHPEFADRKTTKVIDGVALTGWFTEDFTAKELKTLRAKERIPGTRPANTAYDGKFEIPTFDEVLAFANAQSRKRHRLIGVAPETKHPTYFQSIRLPLEPGVLKSLKKAGRDDKRSKVVIQSFETSNLKELARRTDVPLVQLTSATGAPYDLVAKGDSRTYADLHTPNGLREVSRYADWLGPEKNTVIPRTPAGALARPSRVVDDAHRAGLKVVVYTFRAENQFLPTDFKRGTNPNEYGDLEGEIRTFVKVGIDAVFSDQPDIAVQAVKKRSKVKQ